MKSPSLIDILSTPISSMLPDFQVRYYNVMHHTIRYYSKKLGSIKFSEMILSWNLRTCMVYNTPFRVCMCHIQSELCVAEFISMVEAWGLCWESVLKLNIVYVLCWRPFTIYAPLCLCSCWRCFILLYISIYTMTAGHGFQKSPIVGKMLSELALDLPPSYDVTLFRLDRFHKQKSKL